MHVGADAMNGFLASMLLLHLAQTNKINREMSAYQMFRVGLDFIRMFTLIQVAAEHFADQCVLFTILYSEIRFLQRGGYESSEPQVL